MEIFGLILLMMLLASNETGKKLVKSLVKSLDTSIADDEEAERTIFQCWHFNVSVLNELL